MGTEKPKADLLPGTLDMLVLKTLTRGQRLELNGCIEGNWGLSANNRRARFYTLTSEGRKHLNLEASRYRQVTGAVARIMGFA